MSSTSSATPSPTPTGSGTGNGNGGGGGGGGPTSSPLLFFVALGFGVVFTNLWIIVGVKYCFRYNQRNRAARALNEHGEPIDLGNMPHHPRRRRREKKLMSMDEVNERFPLIKYKTWRSSREAEGLPAAGGVTAPPSRAASIQDEAGTIGDNNTLAKQSSDSARPQTALSIAQQDHANAISGEKETAAGPEATSSSEKTPDVVVERTEDARKSRDQPRVSVAEEEDDEDEDDPIRTAAPPEMLAAPGDTCAICLDSLDDDEDVRGLTCGHAFHGACVDPWLTTRRACCPLCKADYYVPKPRPEGEEAGANTGRRRHHTMPSQPPVAWIGGRGVALRPRMMFASPRFFTNSTTDIEQYRATPTQQNGGPRREQDAFYQEPATERQQTSPQQSTRTWRNRIPYLVPRFGRRNQQPADTAEQETIVTAGQLEAGTRA